MPVRDMDGSLGNKILNSGDLAMVCIDLLFIDYKLDGEYTIITNDEPPQNQITLEDYLGSLLETDTKTSK